MHDLLRSWQEGETDWVDPVFTYAPMLLLTVDRDLAIINVSQHLLDEFGYSLPELKGQQLTVFIGDSANTIWPQLVVPSIKNDFQIHEAETEFTNAGGDRVPVLISAASKSGAGEYEPVALLVLNQHQATIRRADVSGQNARDFFRTMNHELRTPMNAIMGNNALLQATPLDYQQRELSGKIQSACDAMMLLIRGLVDDESVPDENEESTIEEFDLRSFVDTVANHWLPVAADKGLAFHLDLEDGLPARIRSDANRLAQVINTLMGNAVRRTASGSVSLQVFPLDVHCPGSHIAFDVQDTNDSQNSSLPAEDMTGCQDICAKLGGTLDATPVWSGEGLYTVTIPTGVAPANCDIKPEMPHQENPGREQFAGCTVLVVEDNQLNQALLKSILENIGISCDLADSGEEALGLCAQNDYDLIFMDIQMPGMNGVTAAKKIRTDLPQYEYCPIIAVTANALKNAREDYLREGLDGYIAKPYSPNDIRRITAQIISNAA